MVRTPQRFVTIPFLWCLLAGTLLGCKSDQLTSHGADVKVLGSKPMGCRELGEIQGQAGHLGGGYVKKSILEESATVRARNQAAEMGATHVVLNEPEFVHGSGKAAEHDQQPALGHGDSSSTYVSVTGVAYECLPGELPTAVASVLPQVENPEASISLLPLGTLQRIVVFQRNPATAGNQASDVEVRAIEDPEVIAAVSESLTKLALDPIKYVPTHRVEFVGDLGSQSLLYGFGYLEYAGRTYRLTTGTFEEELGLVEPPAPEVESDPPPASEPSAAP